MTIAFFSNVLNSHQIALCDAIYKQNKGNFFFIQTRSLSESRKAMGFKSYEREYLRLAQDDQATALKLAGEADVAIFGADSFDYLKQRINQSDKVTFSYSERWCKQGLKNLLSPALLRQIWLYITKGRTRKWYMLAAGGYLANDLRRIGIFRDRVFKWGYFPDYSRIPSDKKKDNIPVKILWVARFIDWKRPDIMIKLAKMLIANNYKFKLTMIGEGVMSQVIKNEIHNNSTLASHIILKGNCPNDTVLSEMASSDIYCFTSTRREGWGAVLGEAMAAACCPVASSDAGATPLLINDGKNGLIFNTDNPDDLYAKVSYLIDNPAERSKMGIAARHTMLSEWSADIAARELISLAKSKLEGDGMISDGDSLPASPAHPVHKKQIK